MVAGDEQVRRCVMVEVAGQSFTRALRVDLLVPIEKSEGWRSMLALPVTRGIRKGEMLRLSFAHRCVTAPAGKSVGLWTAIFAYDPQWVDIIGQEVAATDAWQRYATVIRASRALPAGKTNVMVGFSAAPHTYDIADVRLTPVSTP